MATVTVSDIRETPCSIEIRDLHQTAKTKSVRPPRSPDIDNITIIQYRSALSLITDKSPTFSLLLSSWATTKNPFFHHICAYLPEHEELYITSDLLESPSTSTWRPPSVLISKAVLTRDTLTSSIRSIAWQKLRPPPEMPMPASGAQYCDGMLYCSQGNAVPGTGGIFYMARNRPPVPVVTNYFGRNFNSVCSVAVASSDGALWFTDPCQGANQGIRPPPLLPPQVYRYLPKTGDLRVVADGLERPHGIALSPDERTVYVTHVDMAREGENEAARPTTTYAFDAVERAGGMFLVNKRVFAYALSSIPMGIACDSMGNVYIGCSDGVEIFTAGGGILGVIEVPGGVRSLAFGKGGELFLCSDQRLWRVKLDGLELNKGCSMSVEET